MKSDSDWTSMQRGDEVLGIVCIARRREENAEVRYRSSSMKTLDSRKNE